MIDIHSHILPGIDDGARTLQDSVNIVRELASQGVTDIIATPHFVNESIFMSSFENNLALMEKLKAQLIAEDLAVNVYLGNEIYIDEKVVELVKDGIITTLAGSKYLLMELPLNDEYQNYMDILREALDNGYKVILAHPERYTVTQDDYDVIEELCEMGVLLQCNIGSIVGKYGKDAKKLVKRLAEDKRIFTLGSDVHHFSGKEQINQARKKWSKYYDEDELEKLLVSNPKKILIDD